METQFQVGNENKLEDRIPLPVIQFEAQNWHIISCNKHFCLLLGTSKQLIKGKSIIEFIDKAFLDSFKAYLLPGNNLDKGEELRVPLSSAKGKPHWVTISGFRDKRKGKELIYLFLMPSQSEEEKALYQNEAIRLATESELLLKQAHSVAKMGHWELDIVSNRLFWSDEIYTIFGCKPLEFEATYEAFLGFIHPEDRSKVQEAYANHLNFKATYDVVHRIITKSGELKFLRERCKTSYDSKGKPIRSLGVVVDITDLKHSEKELEEKIKLLERQKKEISELHQLMELTLEQAVDGVITINDKKEIIFVNQSIVKLLGFSKEELLGKNVNVILPFSDRAAHDKAIEANLSTGINKVAGTGREFIVQRKDESKVWVHLSLSKVEFMGRFLFTAFLKDISARKNAEMRLVETQNRFEAIGAHTNTMAWEVNSSGLFTYVSKSSKELLGYSPEELENKMHYFDLHPEAGRKDFIHATQEVFKRKESFRQLPNQVVRNNGEVIWVSTNGFPILDPQGNLLGYQGSDTDISIEKEHEEEIHLLKQAIDSSTVSITLATAEKADFPLIYVNNAFCQLTGYSAKEVLGKNCRFLQNGDSVQEGLDALRKAIQEAKPVSVIIRNYTKGGKLFYNQLSITPIFDKANKLTHFLGIQKDITQLKKVELALHESEANLKALLNSSSESVWSIDRDYRIIYSNEVFSREFKEAFGHFLIPGDSIISLLPEGLKIRWKSRYDKVLAGESISFTERIPTESHVYYVNVVMNPIIIDEQVKGVSIFSKNVSAEEEAKQALSESEERFKSLFIGNITPMLLIDPTDGNITDFNPAAEKFYGYKKVEAIGKSIGWINTSIQDFQPLFKLLKQKSGIRQEFKHRKADGSLIDVEVFCSLIHFSGKEIVHETVHDITERNRFFNAMESQNKILREIAWTQSHVVRAPLARLMGLMQLLDDSGQELFENKQLVEMMKSSANELDNIIKEIAEKSFVANSFGDSSDFTNRVSQAQVEKRALHVLLVDDDKMVQLLQKAVIRKHGLCSEPEVFMSAETALGYLKEQADRKDNYLIFLDINMPGMNGWLFLEELENIKFSGDIRVIMLSSSVDLEDKVKARSYPRVIDYQTKPLNNELLDAVKMHPALEDFFHPIN